MLPPKTERRAELYNEKESQITPTLSSVHPKTHTPITDIIIHQTDNMFKPEFIPRARQAAVVSKNALLYSAGVKREKVHHVIDRVAFYVA